MVITRRIRRIGILRTATVLAVVYVVASAVLLVPAALAGLVVIGDAPPGSLGSVEALLGAVIAPLFYGFVGWPITAFVCLVYNAVSRFLGGIEVEVEVEGPILPGDAAGDS